MNLVFNFGISLLYSFCIPDFNKESVIIIIDPNICINIDNKDLSSVPRTPNFMMLGQVRSLEMITK